MVLNCSWFYSTKFHHVSAFHTLETLNTFRVQEALTTGLNYLRPVSKVMFAMLGIIEVGIAIIVNMCSRTSQTGLEAPEQTKETTNLDAS